MIHSHIPTQSCFVVLVLPTTSWSPIQGDNHQRNPNPLNLTHACHATPVRRLMNPSESCRGIQGMGLEISNDGGVFCLSFNSSCVDECLEPLLQTFEVEMSWKKAVDLRPSSFCFGEIVEIELTEADVARAPPFATAASIDDPVLPALPRLTASSQLP
ncbi:uncharacterized protein B0T23DRAFT_388545 [Neurospora hispaniola]|uniref:Uncharacterized protein n=1 Tax=Neurospora hispaniola TaxID=588809 RepID=A0AAJ0MN63_9PEZI|nr:hypothetical protein B0T23DRAFT_388545 [Neurospora hispaniola]